MSQVTSQCQSPQEQLRTLYAPVRDELNQIETILRDQLRNDFPFIDGLARHGFQLGGKRLRPALVLLAGLACGPLRPEHRTIAAVLELIHTATLIHDDVLDEARLRRHLETVNARWGNEASVLLGDYLFARAICLAATVEDTCVTRAIADATRVVCEGELRQVGTRGHYELSESEYLEIVAAKTAELCACCCRLGGHFAGGDVSALTALERYGRYLGIAFQITDDVLDLCGSESVVGKSLGTDLAKGKPTLPLIRLLNQTTGPQGQELMALLCRGGEDCAATLLARLRGSDALNYAQEQAACYARRAADQLLGFPPSPAVESLARLAEYVITRDR